MAKASQIGQRTEEANVTVVGLPIALHYYPERFSPHILRQFAGLVAMQTLFNMTLADVKNKSADEVERELLGKLDEIEAKLTSKTEDVADILSTLIASWDLEEDVEDAAPGAFVALTPERLAKFGFIFLFKLLEALMAELKLLGEARGARSNGHLPASSGARPRRRH